MGSTRWHPVWVGTVGSKSQLNSVLSRELFGPERPAPTNLDGLADLLRESGVKQVVVRNWRLPVEESVQVEAVLADVGVRLYR